MQHHVISALNLLIHLPHQPQASSGPSAALKTRSRVVSAPSSSFVPFLLPQAPTWALLQVPIWERLCLNSWSPLCTTATIHSPQLPAHLPGRDPCSPSTMFPRSSSLPPFCFLLGVAWTKIGNGKHRKADREREAAATAQALAKKEKCAYYTSCCFGEMMKTLRLGEQAELVEGLERVCPGAREAANASCSRSAAPV